MQKFVISRLTASLHAKQQDLAAVESVFLLCRVMKPLCVRMGAVTVWAQTFTGAVALYSHFHPCMDCMPCSPGFWFIPIHLRVVNIGNVTRGVDGHAASNQTCT